MQALILHQVNMLTLAPAWPRDMTSTQNSLTKFQSIENSRFEPQDGQHEFGKDIVPRSPRRRTAERRQKHGKPFKMRVSFASSLIGRIWDIAFSRSQTGVSWTLTTWNVIPAWSPIFEACRSGDIKAIRERICDGSASLLDVNEAGGILLDVRFLSTPPTQNVKLTVNSVLLGIHVWIFVASY